MYNNYESMRADYYNHKNNNYNQPTYSKDENEKALFDPYAGLIRGNMFKNLYNDYKLKKPLDIQPMNEQAELLTYIDSFTFAAHDISLYLDIYSKDTDMINLFNEYRTESNRLIDTYEKKYGPLFVNSSANTKTPWEWNISPWPWEN